MKKRHSSLTLGLLYLIFAILFFGVFEYLIYSRSMDHHLIPSSIFPDAQSFEYGSLNNLPITDSLPQKVNRVFLVHARASQLTRP